jgi:hypothetical protein
LAKALDGAGTTGDPMLRDGAPSREIIPIGLSATGAGAPGKTYDF